MEKTTPNLQGSLLELADRLVSQTKDLLRQAKTEEDLRIGFEKLLEPISSKLNLKSTPKYEKSVYRGRSDAVHGQVIIEYEPPKSFSLRKEHRPCHQLKAEGKEKENDELVKTLFGINKGSYFRHKKSS